MNDNDVKDKDHTPQMQDQLDNNDEQQILELEDEQQDQSSDDQLTVLQQEIKTLQQNLKEVNDKYLRQVAELENTRKRYEKSLNDSAKFAIYDFAKELISISDIFDKALASIDQDVKQDHKFKNFVEGIELTYSELDKIFQKFSIVKINPLGEKLDANYHETLFAKEDSNQENNTVSDVVEVGYMLHDRILRSAKVGIIKNNDLDKSE